MHCSDLLWEGQLRCAGRSSLVAAYMNNSVTLSLSCSQPKPEHGKGFRAYFRPSNNWQLLLGESHPHWLGQSFLMTVLSLGDFLLNLSFSFSFHRCQMYIPVWEFLCLILLHPTLGITDIFFNKYLTCLISTCFLEIIHYHRGAGRGLRKQVLWWDLGTGLLFSTWGGPHPERNMRPGTVGDSVT